LVQQKEYITLGDFKEKACCLPCADEGYIHPEPKDVATLINLAGWSQSDTAKLVGVSYSTEKGSSTIRKWKSSNPNKEHRAIPYSAWRLMLLYAGVVEIESKNKVGSE